MLNFQEMIAALTAYWANQGCCVHQGYDLEVGAGTFNPATFLRCLGPEPYKAVYVEPSRRPKDGRYGENPNRLQAYYQMQVILKPSPSDIQDLYLKSLETIGLDLSRHDIRFVHDDWENPTIGAWGLGWEVWADGMEVTQFTYFQAIGGLPVHPVSGEITYGLERLALYIQGVDSFFDLKWNDELLYGELFQRNEWEWSRYNFQESTPDLWLRHFDDFEKEAKQLIAKELPIPAYDFVMKASHAFNMLDARGVISITERTGYMARIRHLARMVAEASIKSREAQNFPLLRAKPTAPSKATSPPPSPPFSANERRTFLLEIGSEELPATFVPIGLAHLKAKMEALLSEQGLSFKSIQGFATPRRLALVVEELASGTSATEQERKGPPTAAAFDAQGAPTAIGLGFFRSIGEPPATLSEIGEKKRAHLEIRSIKGTPYLFALLSKEGISTRALLAEKLPELILHLDFPKKMRWGDLSIEYARPLRWLVALYGEEVLPFQIAHLHSGRISYGHRQIAPQSISLAHAEEYVEQLRRHFVMVDIEERKTSILSQVAILEEEVEGRVVAKEKVLSEVLHLVEWPFCIALTFDPSYLKAPKEVLISEQIEHQRYFPLLAENGELLPRFIVVCNNRPSEEIARGNERALAPRLADGLFLFQQDLKTPLATFGEKLKEITFQKELGSIAEKARRIERNAEILHELLHFPPRLLPLVKRAAALCKADLATELVGEFPHLQGTIGRLYALESGEAQEVAEAIYEHWMPTKEGGALPQTPCGILLSLAEKFDNLLGCFALGFVPTSSSDPYALRRQSFGIVKILLENRLHLPLKETLRRCFTAFLENPFLNATEHRRMSDQKEALFDQIFLFIQNRFKTVLSEEKLQKEEMDAALGAQADDLFKQAELAFALRDLRRQAPEQFELLFQNQTRIRKILHAQPSERVDVNPAYFREEAERVLFEKITRLKSDLRSLSLEGREAYLGAFRRLLELSEPLEEFFNQAKVLDEDLTLRRNRLALLTATLECFSIASLQ